MYLMIFTLSLLNLVGFSALYSIYSRKRDSPNNMDSVAVVWFVGVTDLILLLISLFLFWVQ
jgi:hypothetical protein